MGLKERIIYGLIFMAVIVWVATSWYQCEGLFVRTLFGFECMGIK